MTLVCTSYMIGVQTLPSKALHPTQVSKPKEITLEEVKQFIYSSGIKYPDIVYAQFREESGNGKSNLAKKANNLFGMKKPGARRHLGVGVYGEYLKYKSWKDSVRDYKIMQDKYYSKLSRREYISKLRKVYSRNKQYLKSYGIK